MRDWEYGTEPTWDSFKLITTADFPTDTEPTSPPVSDDSTNAWAGKSVQDVENYVMELEKTGKYRDLNAHHPIILDDHGLIDGTCVLLSRAYQDEPFEELDRFVKTRLPWNETHIMWANLDIANMDFEEYCNQDKGDVGDGWWEYESVGDEDSEKVRELRSAALEALEESGHA